MFTNAYIKSVYANSITKVGTPVFTFRDTKGNNRTAYFYNSKMLDTPLAQKMTNWNAFDYSGVQFGTGDTPPTAEDFYLAGSRLSSGLSVACSVSSVADDTGITTTGIYTITNTGSTEITVKEFIITSQLASASSGSLQYVTLYRDVLDTPVAIAGNGGVGKVEVNMRMDYPTT